jgi:hypothetical protein
MHCTAYIRSPLGDASSDARGSVQAAEGPFLAV